jgi:tripartite-type tricarboxylate transporter receptor subunit TctC
MMNLRSIQRYAVLVCTTVALVMTSNLTADAQDYPRKQVVKIVVPFPPGGGVDVVARLIAPRLGEAIGQTVIVENRAGAGGSLGTVAAAKAAPDGYTILLGSGSTMGSNAVVYTKLPYDPVRDFAPVVLISESPFLLVVNPNLPVRTVRDLIKLAQEKPGQLNHGSFGTGSNSHLAAALFNELAKIETNHIPYRGSAPALTDLIGGRIQYTFDGVQSSISFIQGGQLRLLAVAGPKQTSLLPGVPTVSESGVTGFDAIMWTGFFVPAGTPLSTISFLNNKVNAILKDPGLLEGFKKLGIEAKGGPPEVLVTTVKNEISKWTDIAQQKNIRVD